MSLFDEVSVEVTGGYVLIAVKIPHHVCAICKAVKVRDTSVESVKQMIQGGHPIDVAFSTPWGLDVNGWDFVYATVPTHTAAKRALVCGKCSKEIQDAKKIGQRAVEAAMAVVAAKIEHWD